MISTFRIFYIHRGQPPQRSQFPALSSRLKHYIQRKTEVRQKLNSDPVFSFCSANERLARLNTLLQNWQMVENGLEQFQGDLREDEQTLLLLDSALQGGTFSSQMVNVVRDVAKLLSETKNTQQVNNEINHAAR